LPSFLWAQKDAPQLLGAIKKVESLDPWRQKWWKTCSESTVTGPKQVCIQFFLDIPTVCEQGQICIRGSMGKISSGEKFLRFQNPAMEEPKIRKKNGNSLSKKFNHRLHGYTLFSIRPRKD